MQATNMQFTLDEDQWEQDWASVLSLASQPGASLEQTHVFALAHIIRRPIIIYGVKFVRSFRGETLGLARFQGKACLTHISICRTSMVDCTVICTIPKIEYGRRKQITQRLTISINSFLNISFKVLYLV